MRIDLDLGVGDFVPHHKVVTLPQDDVSLVFHSPLYACGSIAVQVTNGRKTEQYRAKIGEPCNITSMCDKAGEVAISVCMDIKGKVAKRWQVESFVVQELPTGKVVFPEIEYLKKENETLKQAILELNRKVEER